MPLAPEPCGEPWPSCRAWGTGLFFQSRGLAAKDRALRSLGENTHEHQENVGLVVLMWLFCSMMGHVVARGGLPATPLTFVASSLRTILPNCAISPILCLYLSHSFQAELRDLFCRPMTARNLRAMGGAGVVVKSVLPGHDRVLGGLWGLVTGFERAGRDS